MSSRVLAALPAPAPAPRAATRPAVPADSGGDFKALLQPNRLRASDTKTPATGNTSATPQKAGSPQPAGKGASTESEAKLKPEIKDPIAPQPAAPVDPTTQQPVTDVSTNIVVPVVLENIPQVDAAIVAPLVDSSAQPTENQNPVASDTVPVRSESPPATEQHVARPHPSSASFRPPVQEAKVDPAGPQQPRTDTGEQRTPTPVPRVDSENVPQRSESPTPVKHEAAPGILNRPIASTPDSIPALQPVTENVVRSSTPRLKLSRAAEGAAAEPQESPAQDPRLSSKTSARRVPQTDTPPRAEGRESATTANTRSTPIRIDIRGGQGDAGAASLGRFLVSGASEVSAATANTGTESVQVSATTVPTITGIERGVMSNPTTPSTTVERLLTVSETTTDVVGAAAKVLSASSSQGRQQVTLQLDPPELGHLRLEIRMHQQAMSLRVSAESHAVARLIENRLPELREALAHHGIRVDRSDVIVQSPSTGESASQNSHDAHRGPQGQADGRSGQTDNGTGMTGHDRSGTASQDDARGHQNLPNGAATDVATSTDASTWQELEEVHDSQTSWLDLVA